MGELLALATAAAFAVSNVLVRVAARQIHGDRLVAPAWSFQVEVMRRTTVVNVVLLWAAWILAAPISGLLLGNPPLPAALGGTPAAVIGGTLAFAAGGLCGPFLARIVLYQGLAHLGPSRLAAGKALAPAFAALLAAVVLGEAVGVGLVSAMVLIGVGTILTVGGVGGLVRVDLQGFLYGAHSAWWLAVAALFRRIGVLALPDILFGAALGSSVSLLLVYALVWHHRRGRRRPLRAGGSENGASPGHEAPAAPVDVDPSGPDLAAPVRRSLLASGLLSTLALIFSIAALAYAPVGPVMAIHHTEPALAQWLGHLALGGTDRVRLAAALGTLMVIAGALLV